MLLEVECNFYSSKPSQQGDSEGVSVVSVDIFTQRIEADIYCSSVHVHTMQKQSVDIYIIYVVDSVDCSVLSVQFTHTLHSGWGAAAALLGQVLIIWTVWTAELQQCGCCLNISSPAPSQSLFSQEYFGGCGIKNARSVEQVSYSVLNIYLGRFIFMGNINHDKITNRGFSVLIQMLLCWMMLPGAAIMSHSSSWTYFWVKLSCVCLVCAY